MVRFQPPSTNNNVVQCPACSEGRYWTLGRDRLKCCQCRKDYSCRPSKMYLSVAEWKVVIQKFLRNLSVSSGAKRAGINRNQYLRAVTEIRKAITINFIHQMKGWTFNPLRENVWLLKTRRGRSNKKQLIVTRTCIPRLCDEGLVYEGGLAFGLLSQRQTKKYLSEKNEVNWSIKLFSNSACSLWANIDEFVTKDDIEEARWQYTSGDMSDEGIVEIAYWDLESYIASVNVSLESYFRIHLKPQRIGISVKPVYFLAEALWKFQNRGLSRGEKINRIFELMAHNKSA